MKNSDKMLPTNSTGTLHMGINISAVELDLRSENFGMIRITVWPRIRIRNECSANNCVVKLNNFSTNE
jgi:hypothetical protein